MEKKIRTFVQAMKDYFGILPMKDGRSPSIGFLEEIKALNGEDRAYFKGLLEGVGYEIINSFGG